MKMSELILSVGDENVVMQNLLNDAVGMDSTKHGTKVAFYTDQVTPADLMDPNNSQKVGLVLWLPRERVNAAIAEEKRLREHARAI